MLTILDDPLCQSHHLIALLYQMLQFDVTITIRLQMSVLSGLQLTVMHHSVTMFHIHLGILMDYSYSMTKYLAQRQTSEWSKAVVLVLVNV